MMRVAIYGRFSTDMQSDASIADQFRLCEEQAKREGWCVVDRFSDHAISGASLLRPGIQELMVGMAARKFDIVLAEALDRISRDQEDIAGFYKRAVFADVVLVTLSEGEISNLHIGLKGTMNALFLKDLADKTRRGLRGRVEIGKSGGGLTFGYDVARRLDGSGETLRGERKINEEQARIVDRIFKESAAGNSPQAIAVRLNKEGVPGPSGRAWGPSTIHGNRRRGTGIINNELYVGRLIWNRLRYIKDPDTGKRVSRMNPEEEWIVKEVQELRIVEQPLWDAVKAQQKALDDKADNSQFWEKRRPTQLFSYLLKCGCCGGGFSKVSATQYGCSNARKKGTCGNRLTISQNKLEAMVQNVLQNHLMDPELTAIFCEEYTRHVNTVRMEHNSSLHAYRQELEKLERERDKIVQSITDGVPGSLLKDKANHVHNRMEELNEILRNAEEAPVLFHPQMAERYRREIGQLIDSLKTERHRPEAAELLRGLIEKIVLRPNKASDGLVIDLYGDLAGILALATGDKKKATLSEGFLEAPAETQEKLVAGARNHLNLLFDAPHL